MLPTATAVPPVVTSGPRRRRCKAARANVTESLKAQKARLRKALIERRLAIRAGGDGAQAAAERFASAIGPVGAAVVAAYVAVRGELDPAPLCQRLVAAGATIVLPAVVAAGRPLEFRPWRSGDRLERGAMSIPTPPPSAGTLEPDVLIVPLLGFDRRGWRLGYGGGYYDTTLARLRARRAIVAVGYAFAAQEVDAVPHGERDQRLDWVVTEREAILIGRKEA